MLQDVLAAVSARMPDVPQLLGKKYLQENGTPPRIIWVPSRDRFGPAQRIGGPSRCLQTRMAGAQLHVWGADVASTEQLVTQLLVALRLAAEEDLDGTQLAPNGYRAMGGGWLDQSWTSLGEVWFGDFEFDFPVLETDSTQQHVVTDFPQTNQIQTGNPPVYEDAG